MRSVAPNRCKQQVELASLALFLLIAFGLGWGILALHIFLPEQMVRTTTAVITVLQRRCAMVPQLFLSVLLVLIVIYAVPLLIYGLASAVVGLKTPDGASPARFLTGVLVSKIGTALAFVLLFYVARDSLSGQWLLYAFIWWLMFVFDEIGQMIGPRYSVVEAVAGVASETIYFPLSGYLTYWLLGMK
jgi:hypothetical protein